LTTKSFEFLFKTKVVMSKTGFRYADSKEGAPIPKEAPSGIVDDSSYKTKGTESVPVVDDNAPVEDPIDPKTADSDEQLGVYLPLPNFNSL
jgi:hypothetical protein